MHFEAPKADRLKEEMAAFLKWFEGKDAIDLVLKAGLAHLWFVTIHPFEDGKGRIARAIADMALARSANSSQRFYSEGQLTSSKHAKLTKCSQDTAHRDIQALVERGALVQNPEGGRSTSYSLAPVK